MNSLLNPYIAGAPVVEPSMFFGRHDVFQWIEHSLEGKFVNHILVIHGQRRVGKTSVLKQIPNFLPKTYMQVFFDLQGRTSTTLDRFLWWMAREISRVLKQEHNLVVAVPEREEFTRDPEILLTQFLPGLLPLLGERRLLLTFDEFDTLEQPEVRDMLAKPLILTLRRMFELEKLSFIFSIGSSGHKLENMQASYTDFFKTALYRKISFLGREDCFQLITRPVSEVLEYEAKARQRIYETTAGHPYFTQLVCHELFSLCQKTGKRSLYAEDVDGILDDVIERGTVNLKFTWDEASSLEKWVMACLAQLPSGIPQPPSGSSQPPSGSPLAGGREAAGSTLQGGELREMLHEQRVRYSEPDLNAALIHLRDKDVLGEDNRFVIYLLQRWLAKNRPLDRVREELVEVNPIANRYIEIGEEFSSRGQAARAIESFKQALAVDPLNLKAQVGIAHVHLEKKDHLAAMHAFEQALSIDDEDVSTRSGLCEACLALGDAASEALDWEGAQGYYRRMLAVNPEHTEARQHLAQVYCQQAEAALNDQQDEPALGFYQQALRVTPEDEALQQRIRQLQGLMTDKAISAVLAESQGEATAGKWAAAIERIKAGLQVYPGEPRLQEALAGILAEQREAKLAALRKQAEKEAAGERWAAALQTWQEYLSFEPDDADQVAEEMESLEAQRSLAEAYTQAQQALEAKDFSRAASLLKKVIVVDENYKDSARLLATAIEGKRQQKPAVRLPVIRLPKLHRRVWKPALLGLAGLLLLAGLAFVGVRYAPAWVSSLRPGATATSLPTRAAVQAIDPRIAYLIETHEPQFSDDFSIWNSAWGEPLPGVLDVWQEGGQMVLTPPEGGNAILESDAINAYHFALQYTLTFDIPTGLQDADKSAYFFHDFRAYSAAEGYTLILDLRQAAIDAYEWKVVGMGNNYSGTTSLLHHSEPNLVTVAYLGDNCIIWINHQILVQFNDQQQNGTLNRLGAHTDQGTLKLVLDDLKFWVLEEGDQAGMPTPAPIQHATPAWVVDFANPILASIEGAAPNFQEDLEYYMRAEWLTDGNVTVDGKFVLTAEENQPSPVLRGSPLAGDAFALQLEMRVEFPTTAAGDPEPGQESVLWLDIALPDETHTVLTLMVYNQRGDTVTYEWAIRQQPGDVMLTQGTTLPTPREDWMTVKVLCSHGKLAFYLGEQPLGYVEGLPDQAVEASIGAGAKMYTTQFYIDNIKVWALDDLNNFMTVMPDLSILISRSPMIATEFDDLDPQWQIEAGATGVDDGQLMLITNSEGFARMQHPALNASDFVASYAFQVLSQGSDLAVMSLEYRITEQARYIFSLTFESGQVRWSLSSNTAEDVNSELGGGLLPYFDPSAVHLLDVCVSGTQMWLYLDFGLLAHVSDATAGEGDLNLVMKSSSRTASFALDTFYFWNLDQVALGQRFVLAEEREFMQVVTRSNRSPDLTELFSAPLADSGWAADAPYVIEQIVTAEGVGSLALPDGGDFIFRHPAMQPAGDFALQLDVQFLEGGSETQAGVAFGPVGGGMYHLELHPGENIISLRDPAGGIVAQFPNPMVTYNTWLRVLLVVRGDKISVTLNGASQVFARLPFSRDQPGNFLQLYSRTAASAQFDNLLFWNLDDAWTWELPAEVQQAILDTSPNFEDDFSTEKAEWQVEPAYQTGQFMWIDGALRILGACPGDHLFQAVDYKFQTDIRFSELSQDREFLYALRSTYTGEGTATEYLWKLNTGTREWELQVNTDPTGEGYQQVMTGQVGFLEAGQWATLSVVVYQNRLWLFWNGAMEVAYQGLVLSGELTHFVFNPDMEDPYLELDNLKFWDLSGTSG